MSTLEQPTAGEPAQVSQPRRAALVSRGRDYGIVIAFLALFIALSFASPAFLTSENLLNILDQNAGIGIIACGGTLVLIAGGFDLSVGAIFALAGVTAAQVARSSGPELGLLAGAAVGAGAGAVNGALATVGRINAFLATLATGIIIRGLAVRLADSQLVTVTDPTFATLGSGGVGDLRYSVICWLVFASLCGFALWRTVYGQSIYSAGGNAEAARLSGVRVHLVRGSTFAISGFAAGIAGVIGASRVSTGQADAGTGLELTAIAAIVIGGTSILGGEGAIWRTLLGVLLLAMIGNGFNLLNVEPTWQQVFQGAVILLAVAVDAWSRRRP